MLKNKLIKGLLGVSAVAAMCGGFTARAQTGTIKPPVTGDANDPTSPAAVTRPAPKPKSMTNNANPDVAPPKVGEVNDQTSPNAIERPAPKAKTAKNKAKKAKVKPPVTGEPDDQTAPGGTSEAAKAAKQVKPAGT